MENLNKIFIATSIDGYIADKNGNIDWLHTIPNPEGNDMGYGKFMEGIDAIVMGRKTFETVCDFDIEWPYSKPVFILSNSLTNISEKYSNKVYLVNGSLTEILDQIHKQGHHNLYIDGGKTIQSFLQEDLIDGLTITTIPVMLGGGTRLFSELKSPLHFKCVESKIFLDGIVQNKFVRIKPYSSSFVTRKTKSNICNV